MQVLYNCSYELRNIIFRHNNLELTGELVSLGLVPNTLNCPAAFHVGRIWLHSLPIPKILKTRNSQSLYQSLVLNAMNKKSGLCVQQDEFVDPTSARISRVLSSRFCFAEQHTSSQSVSGKFRSTYLLSVWDPET